MARQGKAIPKAERIAMPNQEQQVAGRSKRTLEECESVIRSGLKTFVEVGHALLEIRGRRLYRQAGFRTFEKYCRER
jgi:hypothetical protein